MLKISSNYNICMNKVLLLLLVLIIWSCSSSKIITLASQGETSQKIFDEKIPINYLDKYIFIEAKINDKSYTFLHDTGYEITTLDKNLIADISFIPVKKHTTTGSSFEDVTLQYGILSSMHIGKIEFKNIGIGLQDLSFIKSPFADGRKIYGIIGTNMMRKGFWQINYKEEVLSFSNSMNNFQTDTNAVVIDMIPKTPSANWVSNKIRVTINSVSDNFTLDTGSYGSFSANDQFLERLNNSKPYLPIVETNHKSSKRKFKISELELGKHKIVNQELLIESHIGLLLGNDFLDEYVVTIDWANNKLYLN